MARSRSLAVAMLLGVAFVLAGPAAAGALAHTRLAASDPGAGAVLLRAPDVVRLHFSEPLARSLSSARVLAPDGREVAGVRVHVDRRVMVVRLPALGRGVYSTLWTAVGSADPHRVRGALVFRVGRGAAPASAAPRDPPPIFAVVLRWLDFALVASLIGALAVVGLVVRPAGRDAAAASRRAEARLLALAAGCGTAALALGFLALPVPALLFLAWEPESSFELLSNTRWGALWVAREALLAVLLGMILLVRRAAHAEGRQPWAPGAHRRAGASGPALFAAAGLATAVVVVRALGGHAAEVGSHTALSVLVLTLHVLAAAIWVGGLVALAVGLWPLLRDGKRAVTLAAWRRFGRLAAASVGLLVATGLYTAGRQVASIDALVTTLYGQGLTAKAGLLLLAGGVGLLGAAAMSTAIGRPRLPRPRTLLAAEAVTGLAVLLAAALVSSTPPPRGPGFAPATPGPGSLTAGGGDLLVTLSAAPNRPGQNVLSAVVASTRRPDPPPPSGVELRFPGRGTSAPMRELGRGRFHLVGDQLSAAGRSRIEAVVRRPGEPDRSVGFDWTTGTAPRRVVISDRPLEPALTVTAALLALAGAAAAAFWLLGRPGVPPLLPQVDFRKDPS